MKHVLCILIMAVGLQAQASGYLLKGVGFTAPELNGESVPHPVNGDIILDALASPPTFKGYNGSGWVHLGGSAPVDISARFTSTSGQSIPVGATPEIVNFEAADYDTNSAVTTGSAWKFTAPADGKYSVKALVSFQTAVFTAGNAMVLDLYKNGSFYQKMYINRSVSSSAATYVLNGSADIALSTGDYIDLRVLHNESAARTLVSGAGFNAVSIYKFAE